MGQRHNFIYIVDHLMILFNRIYQSREFALQLTSSKCVAITLQHSRFTHKNKHELQGDKIINKSLTDFKHKLTDTIQYVRNACQLLT